MAEGNGALHCALKFCCTVKRTILTPEQFLCACWLVGPTCCIYSTVFWLRLHLCPTCATDLVGFSLCCASFMDKRLEFPQEKPLQPSLPLTQELLGAMSSA